MIAKWGRLVAGSTVLVDMDPPGGGFVHEGFLPTANILLAIGVDASIHEGQLIHAC